MYSARSVAVFEWPSGDGSRRRTASGRADATILPDDPTSAVSVTGPLVVLRNMGLNIYAAKAILMRC